MHGQAWAQVGQSSRDLFRELRGEIHRHEPVHPEPIGADTEVQTSLLGELVRMMAAQLHV